MFVNNNLYNEVYLMLKLNTLSRLNFPKFSKKYLVDVFIDSILLIFEMFLKPVHLILKALLMVVVRAQLVRFFSLDYLFGIEFIKPPTKKSINK